MSNKTLHSAVRTADVSIGPLLGRQLVPLVAVALLFWVLWDRLPALDISLVWQSTQQVTVIQWAMAALATIISFWAVGQYDQVIHGIANTSFSPQQARVSGTAAMAVAQLAGFGVLSSALARWRLLPNITLTRALRISLAVSISFLAGWAVVTAIIVLVSGFQPENLAAMATITIAVAVFFLAIIAWQPGFIRRLPTLHTVGALLGLTFVDTVFAGIALYILLPGEIGIPPTTLIPAFLLALGCGLVGGTPGGVGPFEFALLALLPNFPAEQLLASVLAFRIIYHVIPAGLACILLALGPISNNKPNTGQYVPPQPGPYLAADMERRLWRAERAEVNLIRQGEFGLLTERETTHALVAPLAHSLVMLADPVVPVNARKLSLIRFKDRAKRMMRSPIVYKCSARTALVARSMGWALLPVSQEAWLRPSKFSTEGACYRQLRRNIRKAQKAGIKIIEGGGKLPLPEMQEISDNWADAHGGERGFTMGRFDRDYVCCQRVFLAFQGDQLLAFITLHEVQREWTLDLMRHAPDTPDGTMHLLIRHAIESAAAARCPRLSLASVPCGQAKDNKLVALFRARLMRDADTGGLRRFKTSFVPNWETLYAASPSQTGLVMGLWAIFKRVHKSG